MKRAMVLSLIIGSFLLVSCTPYQVKWAEVFNSMTVDSVKQCTTVRDDEMSNFITFSSRACLYDWYDRRLDFYVRAFIHKKTGYTSYQIYSKLISDNWSYPYAASYLLPGAQGNRKLLTVDGNRLSFASDVDCGSYSCTHYEQFTFPLEKRYLDALSNNLGRLSRVSSREKFRISRRAEGDIDFVMNINELVGVYRMVENY